MLLVSVTDAAAVVETKPKIEIDGYGRSDVRKNKISIHRQPIRQLLQLLLLLYYYYSYYYYCRDTEINEEKK